MAAPGTSGAEREADWRDAMLRTLQAHTVLLAQLVDLVGKIEMPAVVQAEPPAVKERKGRGR